jgi:prevent-host-death family protein
VAIVNVREARAHLSRLLKRVERGEEIVIGNAGRPVARLVPVERPRAARRPGPGRGRFTTTRFDSLLPKQLQRMFGA